MVAWSADGHFLASAGQDGKARVWSPESGTELLAVAGGAGWVEHVLWNPLRPVLVTGAGKKLRVWNMEGTMLREYPDQSGTISSLTWKPGTELLTCAAYHTVSIYDLEDSKALRSFTWLGSILTIAWSPDAEFIATGDQDSTVHFWFAKSGKDLQMWGYPTKVRELAWDRNSRYLATGGGPAVTIWDCHGAKGPEGSKPQMLKLHEDLVTVLAYQKSGDLLVSGGADGKIAVWDPLKQGQALARGGVSGAVSVAAWSPDDRWIAVGIDSGVIKVLAVPTS
jgi:WD40 repeat protein